MTDDNATRIDERRRQWQRLPADQRIRRVHTTATEVIIYARWLRSQRRRRNRSNDYLFIKEQHHDYLQSH